MHHCTALRYCWTDGSFFACYYLKQLGLQIQLGHNSGRICLNLTSAKADAFIVIDVHGIHETAQPLSVQLLRRGLFPYTVSSPQTAATFQVLDLFQMLSIEGQVSAFEFYKTLAQITDKTKIDPPRDRYSQFLCMSREWRHLLQLKRSACGHDPVGAEGTKPGGLAVLCPACPQPGMNLPADLDENSWLHALFIGIDTNFRLKRKNILSDLLDPGLSHRWGYFVEDSTYQAHVTNNETPVEKSSCVSHKAVNDADKCPAKGLIVNGVGTVECTRHDFKYVNMDYIFFSSIKTVASKIPQIIALYDIACQWHIHLWRCMQSLLMHLQYTAPEASITTLVPKFHLPAHISTCQAQFSFNYTPGIGRTNGEAPERGWDYLNPATNQTKEMGLGSRCELLKDLMGSRNWKKTIVLGLLSAHSNMSAFSNDGAGNTLLRRMKEAVPKCSTHVENHCELEAHMEVATILEWHALVEAWEADHSKPNPYMAETTSLSQDAVRLRLVDAEAAALAGGTLEQLHDKVTPTMYVATGIDLEQQHTTEAVSHMKLCLPSGFKTLPGCSSELREIEWQLRHAQAHDALNAICTGLHLRVSVFHHKDCFDRGQHALTRTMGNVLRIQSQIDAAAEQYRVAHKALVVLSQLLRKDDNWRRDLQELASDDIRGLGDGLHSSLRLEWCKSRACALRWMEEVVLLKEEMRRVLAFLCWQADWWESKVENGNSVVAEGLNVYARRQADIWLRLAGKFAKQWAYMRAKI
ncbi:hypothetical protein BDN71DRAFT_1484915 [Pleurotus eryngii]|uniref:CxC2-like cysteine cluster KDZ transposase-associated domain-containing protein n=1 Tax=Pleurotus eryngii TaxID=5323 RepID=A0A9P5ZJC6_PLEER|nr:hypothetical protein BDN71DRAFT_1484915 [Pleurotus eryngii]